MLAAHNISLSTRLAGVSAAFRAGEVTAICGPNGAGKSTLLHVLAGLLAPDTGGVRLDDAPLSQYPAQKRAQMIGFLPQSAEIAWDLRVDALVALGRLPFRDQDQTAVDAAIAAMELAELRHRPVMQLSGGERARALMARVLAGAPRWILADEPLANLDLAHAAALMGKLREQADAGVGVVLVMHDLAAAMNCADRVVVLDRGQVAAEGPPDVALSAEVIAQVWGVRAMWLGEVGARALAIS
jgi:iron complex transport system ATP-binding protein